MMDIREEIIGAIREEIIGPATDPKYKDTSTEEEILLRYVHGSPKSRYGAGMLYPVSSLNTEEIDSGKAQSDLNESYDDEEEISEGWKQKQTKSKPEKDDLDYEEPVGLANQFLPSAMGFTVRFRTDVAEDKVVLNIKSAFYEKGDKSGIQKKYLDNNGRVQPSVNKVGEPIMSDYWIRRPIKVEPIELKINSIFEVGKKEFIRVIHINSEGAEWLSLKIYDRSTKIDQSKNLVTYTFVLVNEFHSTTDRVQDDKHILFQNELNLESASRNLIAPYKERHSLTDTEEERELNLLYRKKRVFAIGHGTSVSWNPSLIGDSESVMSVKTDVIPVYEMPQVAPTQHVELSMLELSDTGDWEIAIESLEQLCEKYHFWIQELEGQFNTGRVDGYKEAAKEALKKCRMTFERISNGVKILKESDVESDIIKSFRWMNRAMLWQQQRSKVKQRKWVKTGEGKEVDYLLEGINGSKEQIFASIEEFHNESTKYGRWRPFQIAFILMNLDSIVNENSSEREIVDLIWFPTGGGKTEAYLGLSAFTIFFRRLKGEEKFDHEKYGGTTVIMRYTLRLLTTQQYERAASLICACDLIRKDNIELGGNDNPISIGLWVGGSSTPNDNNKARLQFSTLEGKDFKSAPYNFVVMKCPCCGAQIGKIDGARRYDALKVKGLYKQDGTKGKVKFKCENENCDYHSVDLPLEVVDEYIYENPPSLLLGTVDKFAMIPWKEETGKLFGFREDENGYRYRVKPPELIIQDELHLIAGPLGSVVGAYETLIQTLCQNHNLTSAPFIKQDSVYSSPKIVASSATISRAKEQVKSLYGTDKLHIFPSQGFDFGNTWFSEEKPVNDGIGKTNFPGRKYVGVLASGYPSAQTAIVRAYSSVFQKVKELDVQEKIDYYWTLLGYFNSIRELGGAMSLVYGDIRERLAQIQKRELVKYEKRRSLYDWKIEELTSRISSDKIPEVLKKLELSYNAVQGTKSNALDVCLATNMVATGVDISRLGLMFIHGQPKTTAEYIQASSRVGRDLPEGPGLVVTLYSPAKPRDKSQYEQFQGYHSRIYSNVEPTSVTPFSINVRERALHAVTIGLIRHFSNSALVKNPVTTEEDFDRLVGIARKIIGERCNIINTSEVDDTLSLFDKRIKFWKERGFEHYGDAGNYRILNDPDYIPLMYSNSAEVREDIVDKSLPTPTSMRGVDTESKISTYGGNN